MLASPTLYLDFVNPWNGKSIDNNNLNLYSISVYGSNSHFAIYFCYCFSGNSQFPCCDVLSCWSVHNLLSSASKSGYFPLNKNNPRHPSNNSWKKECFELQKFLLRHFFQVVGSSWSVTTQYYCKGAVTAQAQLKMLL